MTGSWNNGLEFISKNKDFRVHVGGRVQFDNSIFHANNQVQFGPRGIGRLRDGADFRRARLRVEGSMYEQMTFATEFDFVNGFATPGRPLSGGIPNPSDVFAVPAPTDLWVNFGNIPLIGNFRVGNQKEPYGFEHLVSSRFLPFMERSFNQDAFYGAFNNGFAPGFQAFNSIFDDRMTWAVGVFKNTNNPFAFDNNAGNIAVPVRLTWLPIYEDDGRELLHLGITGRQTGLINHFARYRVRGPERAGLPPLWPQYANTGNFVANGGRQDINLEAVSVLGPWEIQAEYNFNFTQDAFQDGRPGVGTLYYSGGYVEVLYFLTGEHREYNRKTGIFDRVVPNQNAYLVKNAEGRGHQFGTGAWQVGIRYNYLDLNDKEIDGGMLNDFTAGLNWFINPNMKFQWNYSVTLRQSPTGLSDGTIQGLGMRYAMDY
jgi:phosphate-selective porin OprO/OprP